MVGTKTFTQHVYIGANLSDSQIAAFLAGEPIVSSATSAPGVLDEVMDFDADGKACNMVMFTQVKNPVDGSYIFRLTGKDNLNGETNHGKWSIVDAETEHRILCGLGSKRLILTKT